MPHIAIISSSVRTGRQSHRVALYFKKYIETNNIAIVEILDLKEYNFPLFDERLQFQKDPAPGTLDFAAKIKSADGIVIVTPEYNGGYPPSLKNATDLLHDEWHRKPIVFATISDGIFGGSQVITSLQYSFWKIGAWTVPARFPVPKVQDSFAEDGTPVEKTSVDKRAAHFLNELLWCIEANKRMAETK